VTDVVLSEHEINKTLKDLKERLEIMLGDRLVHLVLYGSRARGDYERSSDVDVAVIVRDLDRKLKLRILQGVAEIELEHLVPLSTLVMSESDYTDLLRRERRIALDIQREGVPL
jgi:uncharacterized protein